MAQKRAALLEKRMRREKESLQRKMQLETELEQKKEEARYVLTSRGNHAYFQRTQVKGTCALLWKWIFKYILLHL